MLKERVWQEAEIYEKETEVCFLYGKYTSIFSKTLLETVKIWDALYLTYDVLGTMCNIPCVLAWILSWSASIG